MYTCPPSSQLSLILLQTTSTVCTQHCVYSVSLNLGAGGLLFSIVPPAMSLLRSAQTRNQGSVEWHDGCALKWRCAVRCVISEFRLLEQASPPLTRITPGMQVSVADEAILDRVEAQASPRV